MVNYANGKIYKIESHLGDKIYIGSTTKQYLSQRMDKHRCDFKHYDNKERYYTSYILFEEYGVENCKIVLLELCPCTCKDELLAKEAFHIKQNNCVNKVIPLQTYQEYYERNKTDLNIKTQLYYKNNKVKRDEYLDKNKEKIKEQRKQYYESHKDAKKLYSEAYKERRNELAREKRALKKGISSDDKINI